MECRLDRYELTVNDKSNEITAIPELLKLLELKGSVVTIDAIGAQKEIVAEICNQGADYVIGLKANQPTLHAEALAYAEAQLLSAQDNPETYNAQTDAGHGRVEQRECFQLPVDHNWMPSAKGWTGLTSLIAIRSERHVNSTGQTSQELRLYISSLAVNATQAQRIVRSHWSVENQLHCSLDVTFADDKCTIRKDHAPQNHAIIKRWALGLLKMNHPKRESR
jgi:predicted transposase YbfD/YdcC